MDRGGEGGVLVHEWLSHRGGSENVFEKLMDFFPNAEKYCLWNESHGRFTDVGETFLGKSPLRGNKMLSAPFMPLAWRKLPRIEADWILVSSHLFAHHARFSGPARDAPKLVYAHSPARYLWYPEVDSRGTSHPIFKPIVQALKKIDSNRALEHTSIAANSHYVAARIEKVWGRETRVIYPPVDIDAFSFLSEPIDPSEHALLTLLPNDFILGVSRFIDYKRMDLVIEAGRATGIPVVLAGDGPNRPLLEKYAHERHPGQVRFVINPSTNLLGVLYHRALALIFPAIEDFGIVPVEAMASGTPVIVNSLGGASESVINGVTGIHLTDWSGPSLREAMAIAGTLNPNDCRARAVFFGSTRFKSQISDWVDYETG